MCSRQVWRYGRLRSGALKAPVTAEKMGAALLRQPLYGRTKPVLPNHMARNQDFDKYGIEWANPHFNLRFTA